MANQFAEFSQLKELKKSLERGEATEQRPDQPKVQQRRSKTVRHPSIHEEHARNEGYAVGQTVRMMDTSDEATISGVRKDCFELTFPDGLVITATTSEFILVNKDEDKAMYNSMPAAARKHKEEPAAFSTGNDTLTIDLHLERIPGNESIPEWAALDFQMDYFRRVLRQNMKHKGKKIVLIHGFGDGSLKEALRRELDEVFPLSCSYQSGTADNFGPGTTIVTIR